MTFRMAVLCVLFLGAMSTPTAAQGTFHVFPQFADGTFSDGSFFRSTLTIAPWLSDANCAITLRGLSVDFGTGTNSSFTTTTIPEEGLLSVRTAGTLPLGTGYATVTCDEYAFAEVTYSFYSASGGKIAEATVFSSSPSFRRKLAVDLSDNARVAVAIANDTDLQRTYDLTLRNSAGETVSTGSVVVLARSNLARFIDEVMTIPLGQGVYRLEVRSADFSDMSAIGLRFTGSVFTTVPAN